MVSKQIICQKLDLIFESFDHSQPVKIGDRSEINLTLLKIIDNTIYKILLYVICIGFMKTGKTEMEAGSNQEINVSC